MKYSLFLTTSLIFLASGTVVCAERVDDFTQVSATEISSTELNQNTDEHERFPGDRVGGGTRYLP